MAFQWHLDRGVQSLQTDVSKLQVLMFHFFKSINVLKENFEKVQGSDLDQSEPTRERIERDKPDVKQNK